MNFIQMGNFLEKFKQCFNNINIKSTCMSDCCVKQVVIEEHKHHSHHKKKREKKNEKD